MSSQKVEYCFRGATVAITGASGGIGRATALRFAQAGASLLLHAHKNVARLDEIVELSQKQGGSAEIFPADFNSPNDRKYFFEAILAKERKIDVWINAAGVDLMSPSLARRSLEEKLQSLVEVDVFATISLSVRVAERMKRQGDGTLFFFDWDGVDYGWSGETAQLYGAAKGAVRGFSRSLAESVAPEVRVRCLSLGWIKTRWGQSASDRFERRVSEDSLQKRWGEPDEVADTILFLADGRSTYVDGIGLRLNGGKRGTR